MTDKRRIWADDDPRRHVDEAADDDVAAAARVAAADAGQLGADRGPAGSHIGGHAADEAVSGGEAIGTTPPGLLNDAAAELDACVAADADAASVDTDPLSERDA